MSLAALFAVGVAAAAPSGTAGLSQDAFAAREKASFEWIYTVGADGFAPGDEVRIYDPVVHGMRWSKWGDVTLWAEDCTPATVSPPASWGRVTALARRGEAAVDGVTALVTRSSCGMLAGSCDADIHTEAWTTLSVADGALEPGDELVLVVGDTSDGADDCGFQLPDRAFPEIAWPALECLAGADCASLDPPVLAVLPGGEATTLLVVAPSQALSGEPFTVKAALLDDLGNAVPAEVALTLSLQGADGEGDGDAWTLSEVDGGWHDFTVTLDDVGVFRLQMDSGDLTAASNPIAVTADPPERSIFWGDIHTHHGYTWTDADGLQRDLNLGYGRDVVGLDVVSESMKASGVEIDEDALWAELQENCVGWTTEGAFLVLLGFEWMGDVVEARLGTESDGHHNVYYDACDAPLGTHEPTVVDGLTGDSGLWAWVEAVRDETGVDAVTAPHAMRYTGYDYGEERPGLQTLIEVYSAWGDNTGWSADMDDAQLAGSVQDSLAHGLRLGWIANSDNHDGWMGNPFAGKNTPGGLTAFVAPALNRADIFAAMKSKRTYATTGHRPILEFSAWEGNTEVTQGAEYFAWRPTLRWRLYGTAPTTRLVVWEYALGGARRRLADERPGALNAAGQVTPEWDGATPTVWWLEAVQDDGERVWSGPIWAAADCERAAAGAEDPLCRCDASCAPDPQGEPAQATRCGGRAGLVLVVPVLGAALGRRRRL